MYSPTLEEIKSRRNEGNLVPIYREIVADLETPVSAFLKISHGGRSFLLESVEGGQWLARYSFIGTDPYLVVSSSGRAGADPLAPIAEELAKHKIISVEGPAPLHRRRCRLPLVRDGRPIRGPADSRSATP